MAFDFPNSPTNGQIATTPAGASFTWDGAKWVAAAGAGSVTSIGAGTGITVSPSPITGTGSVSLTSPVTAVLGGTGQTAWTQGDILYASATNTLAKLAKDANATRYLSNAGTSNNPIWGQVNLANGVSGTLPIANGGTGQTTAAAAPWVETAGDTMTGKLTISLNDGFLLQGASGGYGRVFCDNVTRKWSFGVVSDGSWMMVDETASAFRMQIQLNGTSYNATGTWSAFSDVRLKRVETIADYTRGLAAVLQLRPVTFQYNGLVLPDDGTQQYGLVAQEVEPVMPELVGEVKYTVPPSDENPEAREVGTFKTVDPTRAIYACINAIKEIDARLRALEGKPV